MENETQYDLRSVKMPRLAGGMLKLTASILESPVLRGLLLGNLLSNSGISQFRAYLVDEAPTYSPVYPSEDSEISTDCETDLTSLYQASGTKGRQAGFEYPSIRTYHQGYLDGRFTPEEVARNVLEAIESSQRDEPKMNIFIAWNADDLLAQARASTDRYQRGVPIGPMDGVPVAVKDEVDMLPFPTTVGTRFLGQAPAKQDSTVVARMRASGALLIGKANMHEIGIGVTGFNPHHGTVRNPRNPRHHTGGSSSGPAAAVAAGFCPVAIGADGGGSIRIPASFCGLVGLKPTYGRVSEFGAAPLTWSMGHLGPLAGSALDAALGYAVLAGPDRRDPNSLHHPPVRFERITDTELSDVVLGVYWPWFRHAAPEVVRTCEELLEGFKSLGARVQEVTIPALDPARVAHLITISSEMAAALDRYYPAHHQDFALETRTNLALARTFTSRDYLHAQRIRTQTIANFEHALEQASVIVTPATAIPAPPIKPSAETGGESDLTQLSEIMRYAPYSNFTGHPAISFPAGCDSQGLPIGFQAIGKPWQEHVLLRLAYAAEQLIQRQAPQVYYPILSKQ